MGHLTFCLVFTDLCRDGESDRARPVKDGAAGLDDVLYTLRQVSVLRGVHVSLLCA